MLTVTGETLNGVSTEQTKMPGGKHQSCLWIILLTFGVRQTVDAKPPNIIFMVADDLGWNDVGFNNPDIISPNLNKLAAEGVILNQSYVQPVCTPSRNAFLSGYYPFRSGLQHMVILPQQAVCAPLNRTFLPQELKKLGYATHAVGKWHLGFCNWNCTPTFRGFDTFYGFYNGQEDYYAYEVLNATDFRDNTVLNISQKGIYSTFVYQERLREIVANHDTSLPLFLYLPFQSVHEPLQVPDEYKKMYPNLKTDGRRTFSGMVTAMDNLIGNLTQFIKEKGMYDDTLFIFTADNGGWTQFYGNNFPLRGGKVTVWEGGTRAAAFLHGWGLQKTGSRYNGMMHAVDWFPTIITAAGGEVKDKDIDGMSMWEAISTFGPSPRTEFIYNLDNSSLPLQGHAAIRQGDFKLIKGFPGLYSGWYPPDQEYDPQSDLEAYSNMLKYQDIRGIARLYNVKDDPTEHVDLAKQMPDVVQRLEERLNDYMRQYVPPNFPANDPAGNPNNFHGAWTPGWC
ncbi:LOW QUALITY PROTEIN: arylsulfatase B-like [Pomacea canaliculata]|uniref:LOW QUALITY PROTEIN: arylsulfatase B-like n=1 Tax=Pomacea canaliculata TaxID=400727 RepID=UPI000D72C09C|nr:LOW QUALITY PROTEIN: arylsulfatase B-like [Pomacea canaliculata]